MYDVALLKKLRRQKGLTQQQVADYLFVDRSTYAYYESGHTRLSVDNMIHLTQLYQISLYEFLGLAKEPLPPIPERDASFEFTQLSYDEQKLVLLFRSGTPEQREQVLNALPSGS